MKIKFTDFALVFSIACVIAACSKVDESHKTTAADYSKIIAYVDETPVTRTAISADLEGKTYVPVLWCPGDELGVYSESESNKRFILSNRDANVEVGRFTAAETMSTEPFFAYYPYNSETGTDITKLKGQVPPIQTINLVTGAIPGDYKVGEHKMTTSSGSQFRFEHLFSPIRIKIDGTGTELENDRLLGIDLTITRDGASVPVSGNFTFNVENKTYTFTSTTNTVTFDYPTHPALAETTLAYATIFPKVEVDDNLNFVIRTSNHTAVLNVTAKTNFASNHIYTFPLILSNYNNSMVISAREGFTTGTFTAATYNIDGLPRLINDDGPMEDGTIKISQKLASKGWDILGFSEDFENHDELLSSLSTYTWGDYKGTVDVSNVVVTSNTDGLGFATKKTTCSFSLVNSIKFKEAAGGLTEGANTNISKGFRHYLVTLKDGVQCDVIITHMNTYGEGDRFAAQNAQLTQIAKYIKDLSVNNRPIVLMGDTNCRYTRNDFKTYFWNYLASDQTYNDSWVTYLWNGVFPTFGTTSIMPQDAPDPSPEEMPLYSIQKGEVVDKIIYINDSGADAQIYANNYLRDEDFAGLADHMPVMVEFYYEKKTTSAVSNSLVGVDSWDEELELL